MHDRTESRDYLHRVLDDELDQKSAEFAAISIEGPKGVGKTETAQRRARTDYRLDGPAGQVIRANPQVVLNGETTILIDEWQLVPAIWDIPPHAAFPRPGARISWTATSSASWSANSRSNPLGPGLRPGRACTSQPPQDAKRRPRGGSDRRASRRPHPCDRGKARGVPDDRDVRHLQWLARQVGGDLLDAVVITTGPYAYRRPDGIAVVPAALLGP